METLLLDAATKLFADELPFEILVALEQGGDAKPLWANLEAAGFVDALVSEARGGVGLSWGAFFPLAKAAGARGMPLPLVETAMLRALIPAAPAGMIAIAPLALREGAGWHLPRVPLARHAEWLAVDLEGAAHLVPLAEVAREGRGLEADVRLPLPMPGAIALPGAVALRELGALAQAARIAGAMARVLDMSLEHATTRAQFGRKIADFQAIQHQLAELAEAVHLAGMAAEMGFAGGAPARGSLLPALAKARTSALVPRGAAIAHAVHGAMGIVAEFPLQYHTRALHAARLAFGTEALWQEQIGAALLASRQSGADFVDKNLTPGVEPAPL